MAAKPKPEPEPKPEPPSDEELGNAIREWRALEDAKHDAYNAADAARVRLVAVLRAAGVIGFTSL